jgi:hypothetical protein
VINPLHTSRILNAVSGLIKENPLRTAGSTPSVVGRVFGGNLPAKISVTSVAEEVFP